MKLTWTLEALGDLAEIQATIADSDPQAASRGLERSLTIAEHLSAALNIGRPGRVDMRWLGRSKTTWRRTWAIRKPVGGLLGR